MNSNQAMLYRAGVGADLVIPIAQNNVHLSPVMQLAKHFATKFVELGAHTLVAERHHCVGPYEKSVPGSLTGSLRVSWRFPGSDEERGGQARGGTLNG